MSRIIENSKNSEFLKLCIQYFNLFMSWLMSRIIENSKTHNFLRLSMYVRRWAHIYAHMRIHAHVWIYVRCTCIRANNQAQVCTQKCIQYFNLFMSWLMSRIIENSKTHNFLRLSMYVRRWAHIYAHMRIHAHVWIYARCTCMRANNQAQVCTQKWIWCVKIYTA